MGGTVSVEISRHRLTFHVNLPLCRWRTPDPRRLSIAPTHGSFFAIGWQAPCAPWCEHYATVHSDTHDRRIGGCRESKNLQTQGPQQRGGGGFRLRTRASRLALTDLASGAGRAGFAKRAGSSLGQHAIRAPFNSVWRTASSENLPAINVHLRRRPLAATKLVKSTFIVPRTNGRKGKTVALGRISGNMGSGMISRESGCGKRHQSRSGTLASGGIGLGVDVGVNVAQEFLPQRKLKRQ